MKSPIAANLFRGIESVGGKLHFNENEMVFESHAINIQTGQTVIPYCEIKSVNTRNTLGLVPNGMLVTLNDGQDFKFVLWNRREVMDFIKEKAACQNN